MLKTLKVIIMITLEIFESKAKEARQIAYDRYVRIESVESISENDERYIKKSKELNEDNPYIIRFHIREDERNKGYKSEMYLRSFNNCEFKTCEEIINSGTWDI